MVKWEKPALVVVAVLLVFVVRNNAAKEAEPEEQQSPALDDHAAKGWREMSRAQRDAWRRERNKGNRKQSIIAVTVNRQMTYDMFAQACGVSVEQLNELNGLALSNNTTLAVGSELEVPFPPQALGDQRCSRHIVVIGDTYRRIAKDRNVDEGSLRALNNARPLRLGVVLELRPGWKRCIVVTGDTYPRIAQDHNVDEGSLRALNNNRPLRAGLVLDLPILDPR